MSRVNEQTSELERQRTYMYDGHHFPRDHAQVERFNALHPWQRRQVVRECAVREIRESMGGSGIPLSGAAIEQMDWESAMTTAAAVRTDAPDFTTAGQVDWMRERGVPMIGAHPTVPTDRKKRREQLRQLSEAGIPTVERVPSSYLDDEGDVDQDQPLHMTPAEQRRWLREAGVPVREVGRQSVTIPDGQCPTCGGNGITRGTVCPQCKGTGDAQPTPSTLSSGNLQAQPKAPAQTPSSLSSGTPAQKVKSNLGTATNVPDGSYSQAQDSPTSLNTGTREARVPGLQRDGSWYDATEDDGDEPEEPVEGADWLREAGIPIRTTLSVERAAG